MKKFNKSTILKAIISVSLVSLLIYKIDLQNLFNVLKNTDLQLFSISWLLFLFQQIVVAYAWLVLLKAQKNHVPFMRVLEVHFIGHFFGTFLPSSVGMDVVRAYGLSKYLRRGVDAASSMFVCRAIGFSVFLIIAVGGAFYLYNLNSDLKILGLVLFVSAAFLLGVFVFLNSTFRRGLGKLLEKFRMQRFEIKIQNMYASIFESFKFKKQILFIIFISVFYQILGIVVVWMIGASLAMNVPIIYYFINIPIIMAITILPISISGLGIREGAFVYFFVQAGAASAEALSLSFLLFFQFIVLALLGGMIYLVFGFSFKDKKISESSIKLVYSDKE